MIYHVAQLNIARFRLPAAHPNNDDFMHALDRVNEVAEQQPGFVWRFTGEGDNAIDVQAFDDPHIAVNMSVWEDLETLAAFAYRNNAHRDIMRRRRDWFEEMEIYLVLWWVKAGHRPSIDEAKERLDLLRRKGPTADAFTFKQPFPAPGDDRIDPILDECA